MSENEQPTPTDGPTGHVLGEWMNQPTLAKELGISVDTLQRWHNLRIGPPRIKVGGKVWYRRDSVRAWLREKEGAEFNGAGK